MWCLQIVVCTNNSALLVVVDVLIYFSSLPVIYGWFLIGYLQKDNTLKAASYTAASITSYQPITHQKHRQVCLSQSVKCQLPKHHSENLDL